MKNLLVLLLFASSLFLRAQSLFDGTWKMKMQMDTLQFSGPPEDYLFAHGMYHCKSCIPKVDVKTDGVDHEVAGYSYDTLAVRILDDHAIKFTMKKAGKPYFECPVTVELGPNGRLLIRVTMRDGTVRDAKGPPDVTDVTIPVQAYQEAGSDKVRLFVGKGPIPRPGRLN